MPLAPDWVCEILSPSTESIDRDLKMPIYAREEVGHVWLVDPESQTLEVYFLENGVYREIGQYHGDQVVRIEPFSAIELSLSDWWTW